MAKIQKICNLQPTLGFSEFDFYANYKASFSESELGLLFNIIPFTELAEKFGLEEKGKGRSSYLPPEGKLALMFLKSYTGLSDRKLIDQLNSNIHYQIFCGIRIDPLSPITNFKIVSQLRTQIAERFDIEDFQQVLASCWKPYLENTHVLFTDATCYESYIRYPTSIKILWEAASWLYKYICILYKDLRLRKPRSKFKELSRRYNSYSKKRKRRSKETRGMFRSLLYHVDKFIGFTDAILKDAGESLPVSDAFLKRLGVIRKVSAQQHQLWDGEKVKDQIVSIDKEYIHPIVRGKETKSVEFGAKINMIQADGINMVEHLSFSAFHEGNRLPLCILKHEMLFGKKVYLLAADAIYATNKNRTYCSERKIITSFVRKGRPGKDEGQLKIIRSILSKERSTRLEGSFGTEKNHYDLHKVKARSKKTEILWILFGIHTANAVRMIQKVKKKQNEQLSA